MGVAYPLPRPHLHPLYHPHIPPSPQALSVAAAALAVPDLEPAAATPLLQLQAQLEYRRGRSKDCINTYDKLFQQYKVGNGGGGTAAANAGVGVGAGAGAGAGMDADADAGGAVGEGAGESAVVGVGWRAGAGAGAGAGGGGGAGVGARQEEDRSCYLIRGARHSCKAWAVLLSPHSPSYCRLRPTPWSSRPTCWPPTWRRGCPPSCPTLWQRSRWALHEQKGEACVCVCVCIKERPQAAARGCALLLAQPRTHVYQGAATSLASAGEAA